MTRLLALAIDPGRSSGYAIGWGDHNGKRELVYSGSCKSATDRKVALESFNQFVIDEVEEMDSPCEIITVIENFTPGGKMGFRTALGLGKQAGRWQEQIELATDDFMAKSRHVKVYPVQWRTAWGGNAGWQHKATGYFSGLYSDTHDGPFWTTEDELTACAILWWSLSQMPIPELVKKALPKKFIAQYQQGIRRRVVNEV